MTCFPGSVRREAQRGGCEVRLNNREDGDRCVIVF
ncbi:hypothetical protein AMURIS_01207 [Acetatifactor muris]|uniref:Uncharacterized protein n=1 Tax=Acetatifactor muris TaxID=879566 RepID=A0A2K4ZDG0_9FIRM|nr:hypothetical protein AMURIS_01207 [Acetatifactor muris]